ncbi:MAG TPA: GAF domain-containing protein [Polyangiaceae bacterium]|nr:GAF domain-containing protein [Polyangiaceae bacterium]
MGNDTNRLSTAIVTAISGIAAAADRQALLAAIGKNLASLPADTYLLSQLRGNEEHELVGAWEHKGVPASLALGTRYPYADYPAIRLIEPGRPFLSSDVSSDPRLDDRTRGFLQDMEIEAVVSFPLVVRDEYVGIFSTGYRTKHEHTSEELELLQIIAQLAAVALAHIEGREALARKVEQLHGLYRAAEELGAIDDEVTMLRTGARMVRTHLGCLSCWIAVLDREHNVLRGITTEADQPREFEAPPVSMDDVENMAVAVVRSGHPAAYTDAVARADAEGWGDVARLVGVRSVAYVPLRAGADVLGVFAVGDSADRIEEDELALLATFGNQLAGAMVRSRMDRERAAQVASLQRAYEQQARLLDVVRELSTPVIPVHDRILVLPLIGGIDAARSVQIMDALLSAVQREGASVVIVDVTGVPMVDSNVANHLMQAIRSVSLLGAKCVLVGISAMVAQTIVHLGIELGGAVTRGNLQAGIAYALRLLDLEIRPVAPK